MNRFIRAMDCAETEPGVAKRVGIQAVAARAGVSVGTVSRVVNGHPAVHPRLRDRVLQAADELDWAPNRVARHLRTGQSQSIGLIVVDISHPFYPDLVRAAESTLESAGFTLVLANTYDDVDREDRILEVMLKQRVAGVLMSPANGDSTPGGRLPAVPDAGGLRGRCPGARARRDLLGARR